MAFLFIAESLLALLCSVGIAAIVWVLTGFVLGGHDKGTYIYTIVGAGAGEARLQNAVQTAFWRHNISQSELVIVDFGMDAGEARLAEDVAREGARVVSVDELPALLTARFLNITQSETPDE